MALKRFEQFGDNVSRAREMVGVGESIVGITSGAIDPSDMYRAALVQAVAALDSYVHDVVLDYSFEILSGVRSPGSVSRVGLHFGAIRELVEAEDDVEFELRARAAINARLSTETFQKPDDIAAAFAMVGVRKIWSTAFGADAEGRKTDLRAVVHRRNLIVHRCDLDPADISGPLALSADDTVVAIETVSSIVSGLDSVL